MALDPSIASMDIPPEWKTELARFAVYYQRAWLQAVQSGDQARASAIITEARNSPWLYNSAGQIFPNTPWFASLSPADQAEYVARLNDPQRSIRQVSELQQRLAATTDPAQRAAIQAELNDLQASQARIANDLQKATAYLTLPDGPQRLPDGGQAPAPPGGSPPSPGTGPEPLPDNPAAPTGPTGAADQGKFSQEVDEAARADPQSFVRFILGQMGADSTGNNPLTASAIRKASLTPYMRELMAGGYQNAPLYTYGDWVENWVKNNAQPGAAGGGTGTAFTMGQGNEAIRGLLGRAQDKGNLEYDALNGGSSQDALSNIKTYLAAGYSDSMDPTYQRALQANADRQHQTYMDSVFGGNDDDSFVDWYAKNGTSWMR